MSEKDKTRVIFRNIIIHTILLGYFFYVTFYYVKTRDTCTDKCVLSLCSPYGMLILTYCAYYFGLIYFKILKPLFATFLNEIFLTPLEGVIKSMFKSLFSKILLSLIVIAVFFGYVLYETREDFSRLRALGGIVLFLAIGIIFSAYPKRINYRPVICGAIFQFLLGVLFIRWPVGRSIFECFGSKIAQFLEFGKVGAAFVYSDNLVYGDLSVFAFSVLTTIIFFSLCISVTYYLGAMQWILLKLGGVLSGVLGTTVCESVYAAGNIFLSMSESFLVIKPFFEVLTHSEIHAVMVSGFSTVSGSVMVAYIGFGANPANLITASVMAAPGSLCFAKLIYPETEESKTSLKNIQLEKSTDTSILDAASNGASQAIVLIQNIVSNLVSFVAFIAFADAIIVWISLLMGFSEVNIAFLLGKVFMPISWLIGIRWEDCEAVGYVIGTKTIVNEFVAFQILGDFIKAGTISDRSAAIATYAICSFANISSVGIFVGLISAVIPQRRSSVVKVAIRSLFSGCLVTLVTASIAGLLLTEELI